MDMQHKSMPHSMPMNSKMYKKLGLMILVSFAAMYILMYSMVDSFSDSVPNINQFYMAGLMTMPMLILELLIMGGMYMNKKLNTILIAVGFIGLVGFFFCIRQQAGVGDRQFLKSMIPHHGAAILMVEKASLTDPEVKKLGEGIIAAQQAEILQMKAKLTALNK